MTTEVRKRTLNNRPPPFPEDFGERLEGLKELSGLSWGEFAERLSVTQRGLAKWRNGGPPSGAYFWAIIELARDVPGGFELMLDGDAGIEKRHRIEDFRAPPWPEDFPARLGRLEDLSGVSLDEFASALGLPKERPREWRRGAMPTADEVWAMALWAGQIPGGNAVLFAPYSQPRPVGE